MRKMFTIGLLMVCPVIGMFAGGIQEKDGQNYSASVFSTLGVHAFVDAGKFSDDFGTEDSADGIFKNGVWYWAGPALLEKTETLHRGNSLQFRTTEGEGKTLSWLPGKYTGSTIKVSNSDVFIIWGTLTFKNGKAVIEIQYIEPYVDEGGK